MNASRQYILTFNSDNLPIANEKVDRLVLRSLIPEWPRTFTLDSEAQCGRESELRGLKCLESNCCQSLAKREPCFCQKVRKTVKHETTSPMPRFKLKNWSIREIEREREREREMSCAQQNSFTQTSRQKNKS